MVNYLTVTIVILTFCLGILGLWDFPKFGIRGRRKKIIMCMLVILILSLSFSIVIINKNKEKEIKQFMQESIYKDKAIEYEIQKKCLLDSGLSKELIEKLGEKPMLELAYQEGNAFKNNGNFKKAIKSYIKILEYRPSDNIDKLCAYILAGGCYLSLKNFEKAMQYYEKALELVDRLEDGQIKSTLKALVFYDVGRIYIGLHQLNNALENLEVSLKENIKLNDYFHIANTLTNIADINLRINQPKIAIENISQSIQAYEKALEIILTDDSSIEEYAMIHHNLGIAFKILAEEEDKEINYENAIKCYIEALKVYSHKDLNINYAFSQDNLGDVYQKLALVKDTEINCKKAIQAYQEALKVYSKNDLNIYYVLIQNNLGATYRCLAEVKDLDINIEKALQAYNDALKAFNNNIFKHLSSNVLYGSTYFNLGCLYQNLALIKDKENNCNKAIQAYGEALKIFKANYCVRYLATTSMNLGTTFHILAQVRDKDFNFEKSIQAYKTALMVCTDYDLRIEYAKIQDKLGNIYIDLAQVKDPDTNYKNAIYAYQEALKNYPHNDIDFYYALILVKLGNAHKNLAKIKNKTLNYDETIKAYQNALTFLNKEEFPEVYQLIEKGIKELYILKD